MKLRCFVSLWVAILGGLVPAFAQPAIMPDATVMNLDELGVNAVGCAYSGQAEQQFPLGWSGFFEDRTSVACEPFGQQNGRRAFLLHCPWRGGPSPATSFQQFTFSLVFSVTGEPEGSDLFIMQLSFGRTPKPPGKR